MHAAKRLLPAPVIVARPQTGASSATNSPRDCRRSRFAFPTIRLRAAFWSAAVRSPERPRIRGGEPAYLGDDGSLDAAAGRSVGRARTDALRQRIVHRRSLRRRPARAARRRRFRASALAELLGPIERPTVKVRSQHTMIRITRLRSPSSSRSRRRSRMPLRRPPALAARSASACRRVRRPRARRRRRRSPSAAPASFDLGVWTVHASSLDANFKNGDFSTPNKVVMTRTGRRRHRRSRQRQLQEARALSQRPRRHARLARRSRSPLREPANRSTLQAPRR